MKKYYLRKRPQSNGFKLVHKELCPLVCGDEMIELGRYCCDYEAFKAARKIESSCQICEFCAEPYNPPPETHVELSVDYHVQSALLPGIIYFLSTGKNFLDPELDALQNNHIIYLQDLL